MLLKIQKNRPLLHSKLHILLLFFLLLAASSRSNAQFVPDNDNNSMNLFQQSDTAQFGADSLKNKSWEDVDATIYYTMLSSNIHRTPDTSLNHFQDFQPVFPWWGLNLGNYGTAVKSLLFIPQTMHPGLSFGYNIYDLYKTSLDSLRFYNTTNPYSAFSFILGSKNQQMVDLMHTQNITPTWNFAANIRALSSQGFFSGQTAKSISGSLNTNYTSKNQRYKLNAALIYDRFSQDENGGIQADSFLDLSNFSDRSRIPINLPVLVQGRDKSAVNNILSDFDLFLRNNYSWGQTDTTYNEDSTSQKVTFTPRFRLQYDFHIHTEKHQYNDYLPDSLRYAFVKPISFAVRDTLFGRQRWTYVDNQFSLNGFLGENEHLLQIQAGIGNRIDHFATLTPTGYERNNSFNTFLFGNIRKEAFNPEQWHYEAQAKLYLTGQALGDFNVKLDLGKQLNDWVGFTLGFQQSLTQAPYVYERLATNFFSFSENFGKTSVTQVGAGLNIPKLKLNVYGNYFLLANYLYFDESLKAQQESNALSVFQIYGKKRFVFSKFSLNNILAWQQSAESSPIHLPAFMIQEQLAFESDLFHNALTIMTGIGVKYTTSYYCDGYSPYLNQFYTQSTYKTSNLPQVNVFFNFGLHHFRAFVSLDELQQLISRNNINAPGYPAGNMMFRFGFKWILVN